MRIRASRNTGKNSCQGWHQIISLIHVRDLSSCISAKFPNRSTLERCVRATLERAWGLLFASIGAVEGVVYLDDVLEVRVHPN